MAPSQDTAGDPFTTAFGNVRGPARAPRPVRPPAPPSLPPVRSRGYTGPVTAHYNYSEKSLSDLTSQKFNSLMNNEILSIENARSGDVKPRRRR